MCPAAIAIRPIARPCARAMATMSWPWVRTIAPQPMKTRANAPIASMLRGLIRSRSSIAISCVAPLLAANPPRQFARVYGVHRGRRNTTVSNRLEILVRLIDGENQRIQQFVVDIDVDRVVAVTDVGDPLQGDPGGAQRSVNRHLRAADL